MEQSHRDSTIRAAWITGGFALAGTVLTLTFQGIPENVRQSNALPPPPSASTAAVTPPTVTATSAPSKTEAPKQIQTEPQTTSVAAAISQYLVGLWLTGEAPLYNIHLTITDDSGYVLVDILSPDPKPLGQGKLIVEDTTIKIYDVDGTTATESWSFERTTEGDFLQVGSSIYFRG